MKAPATGSGGDCRQRPPPWPKGQHPAPLRKRTVPASFALAASPALPRRTSPRGGPDRRHRPTRGPIFCHIRSERNRVTAQGKLRANAHGRLPIAPRPDPKCPTKACPPRSNSMAPIRLAAPAVTVVTASPDQRPIRIVASPKKLIKG